MSDEFYIGYRKVPPPKQARFVGAATTVLILCVVVTATSIGGLQRPPDDGRYAFGSIETFEGPVLPAPMLHVEIGGEAGEDPSRVRKALIVGRGKHGAPDFVRAALGKRVRFGATRIERGGLLLLETKGPRSFEVLGDAPVSRPAESPATGREVTLSGELVDTKCFFGVMKPGRGKVHRGCAAECLRGGVPPGLLVRATDGEIVVFLRGVDPVEPAVNPEWAGRRLRVVGELVTDGGLVTMTVNNAVLDDHAK